MSTFDAAIEAAMHEHRWTGGYFCTCGAEMNSAVTYVRHVVSAASEEKR